jgi:cold shock CspA family protein
MKGKIDQWNDDKGFGFIKPDNGSEKIFFHVSSVKTNARRPRVGDIVLFDSTQDSQQRLKAKSVVIEGVTKAVHPSSKPKFVPIEPRRKNILDYILLLVCVCSLAASGFEFFRSGVFESSLVYGVPAVIALLLLNRQKKPKEKSFSCSGCRQTVDYDSRTIEAWNKGFTKLYCKTCHLEWLKNNPLQDRFSLQSKGSGCLGIIAFMIIIPAVGSIWLYNWLA